MINHYEKYIEEDPYNYIHEYDVNYNLDIHSYVESITKGKSILRKEHEKDCFDHHTYGTEKIKPEEVNISRNLTPRISPKVRYKYKGEYITCAELARIAKVKHSCMWARLNISKMSVEDAISYKRKKLN